MVKRHQRHADGLYHIKGRRYKMIRGTRAQVWHQTAFKTEGGLEKHQLLMNKHGRIVSRKKHKTAKKEQRLKKAGYGPGRRDPVTGKFGAVRISKKKGSKKTRKRDKRGRYSKGGDRRRRA